MIIYNKKNCQIIYCKNIMKIHKGHIHGVSFNLYKNSNDSGIVLKRETQLSRK